MKQFVMITTFFLMANCIARSQLNFFFQPEVYGRTVEGLGVLQLQNLTGSVLQGKIIISVKETSSRIDVVTIITPNMQVGVGTSTLARGIFAGSSFMFPANAYSQLTNQTRNFPPGQYSFCYRFVPADKAAEEYENCFDSEVQPLVPMTLVYPADRDKICEKRPVLSWQPPLPFHASMRFRLLLTEKKQGESVENLLVNMPLVLVDNITTNTINYPTNYPDLQEGRTYCWQVIAYQNKLIVSRSEIWEFTVQCNESPKKLPNDSYRELKMMANGNHYIANRVMRFSFTNSYSLRKLNYSLHDIENEMKKIKNTPEIKVMPGLNKIDLDLTDLDLVPGRHYVLKVYPFNEPAMEVRFVYKDEEPVN